MLIISATIVVGYCYLFQPHIAFVEVRISKKPNEMKAIYVNVTGDPLCAKLYRIERMKGDEPIAGNEPLFLALPKGMPSPEDGKFAYSGNLFLIEGYGYQYEERNKLTGKIKTTPSNRFDVIAWEVIAPYKVWKNSDPGNNTPRGAITAATPVANRMESSDQSPSQFIKGNYVDCLR